jgi:uncharacterized protein (DUF1684 family)
MRPFGRPACSADSTASRSASPRRRELRRRDRRHAKRPQGLIPAGLAAALALGIATALVACSQPWPDPPTVDSATFLAEHEAWRARRRAELTDSLHFAPRWAGLWPLAEGETPFGADSSLPIVLRTRAPARRSPIPPVVGRIERRGREASVRLAPGVSLRLHDGSTAPPVIAMKSDSSGPPTCLRVGTLHVWLHNELGKLYIRAADEALYPDGSFPMPEQFTPDPAWRVAANLERFREPRTIRLPDVTAETQEWVVPGRLVFRLGGREFRATPVALPAPPGEPVRMRLMFRDSTSGRETFELTRYLTVPPVDSTGWTVIDFNRAYNPPCAFTAYSVCVLPPRENRLAVAIRAGEKRFQ